MADSAPWGNTRYFWRKLPVCFSKLWVSITQLLSLTLYGSAKHYHHQLIILRTKSLIPWDKLWPRDRQFPHWVPYISHGPEYACALWEWGLWALQIFPGSLLSRSRATQKEHLIHTGLMAHCWFITSTQRQGTEKKKEENHFLSATNWLVTGSLCQGITLLPSLWKRTDSLSVMASDFTAPEAEEPSCTIIRTLQPNVLWPARLEMMKSIDSASLKGPTHSVVVLRSLSSLTIKYIFFSWTELQTVLGYF